MSVKRQTEDGARRGEFKLDYMLRVRRRKGIALRATLAARMNPCPDVKTEKSALIETRDEVRHPTRFSFSL